MIHASTPLCGPSYIAFPVIILSLLQIRAKIQRKDLNLVRSDLAVVLRAGQAVATAVSYTIKQPNGHQRISVHSLSDQLPSIRSSNCLDRNGSHHSPWLDTVGLICPFCHEFDLPPKFVTLSLGFSLKCLGLLLAGLIFVRLWSSVVSVVFVFLGLYSYLCQWRFRLPVFC